MTEIKFSSEAEPLRYARLTVDSGADGKDACDTPLCSATIEPPQQAVAPQDLEEEDYEAEELEQDLADPPALSLKEQIGVLKDAVRLLWRDNRLSFVADTAINAGYGLSAPLGIYLGGRFVDALAGGNTALTAVYGGALLASNLLTSCLGRFGTYNENELARGVTRTVDQHLMRGAERLTQEATFKSETNRALHTASDSSMRFQDLPQTLSYAVSNASGLIGASAVIATASPWLSAVLLATTALTLWGEKKSAEEYARADARCELLNQKYYWQRWLVLASAPLRELIRLSSVGYVREEARKSLEAVHENFKEADKSRLKRGLFNDLLSQIPFAAGSAYLVLSALDRKSVV